MAVLIGNAAARWVPLTLVLALVGAGCLGTTPQDRERDALGGDDEGEGEDDDDEGPEHRPGQPCLLCHDFEIAGTVYMLASDRRGVTGAEVIIDDSAGQSFTAITNRAGNFYVTVKGDLSVPRQRDRGRLQIPFEPEFPLQITIRRDGIEQEMETLAWREGSCAGCHGPVANAESVGRIYLVEEP